MDKLVFTSLSGQDAVSMRLRQVSNEIANASTTAFKRSFPSGLKTLRLDGEGFASRYVSSPTLESRVDLTPGPVLRTGNPLDISLGDDQLLVVKAINGETAYTRRGDLKVGADGTLRVGSGLQVLDQAGAPIAVPALAELKIGTDGTVLVLPIGAQAGTFTPLTRMQIAQADPAKTVLREDGLFAKSDKSPFSAATLPRVLAGSLESSNSNLFSSMVEMITLSRQYEMTVKILKETSDLAQKTQTLAKLGA